MEAMKEKHDANLIGQVRPAYMWHPAPREGSCGLVAAGVLQPPSSCVVT